MSCEAPSVPPRDTRSAAVAAVCRSMRCMRGSSNHDRSSVERFGGVAGEEDVDWLACVDFGNERGGHELFLSRELNQPVVLGFSSVLAFGFGTGCVADGHGGVGCVGAADVPRGRLGGIGEVRSKLLARLGFVQPIDEWRELEHV